MPIGNSSGRAAGLQHGSEDDQGSRRARGLGKK